MSRKPTKGYFVRGKFVAEGSELDIELKAELKGTTESSKSDLKKEMDALQDLGKELMGLRSDLFKRLQLPEILVGALAEAKRITNFEGKRRQMQYVGKLMRKLDESEVAAINAALTEQKEGSSIEKALLHAAEQWRDRMIVSDDAVAQWINEAPETDIQQLRSLVRQARKDMPSAHDAKVQESTGQATRKGRAYRELFQLVRDHVMAAHAARLGTPTSADEPDEDEQH
ncbi:ribosome biogenesis factor YjgA [Comamonas sp. J-3]|uniref:ribosome biogenesis factor YjgA n=1 Tax=Comamonas trifloxystrobinivorans TaxID=3350256 RepID=UPI00372700C8